DPKPRTPPNAPAKAVAAQPELPPLDIKYMAQVIDRLGRAANTPDERVSHLMALGRLRDAESKPALAAEAYQSVLSDTTLSAASWQGRTASVRAEIEATRRIRQLLLDRGAAAYTAFEAQAAAELAALGAGTPPAAFEKLA